MFFKGLALKNKGYGSYFGNEKSGSCYYLSFFGIGCADLLQGRQQGSGHRKQYTRLGWAVGHRKRCGGAITEENTQSSENLLGNESTQPSAEQYKDGELTYTNLTGDQVCKKVRDIMLKSAISEAAADKFFTWVKDYNQAMGKCESFDLKDGFVTVKQPVIDYGDYYPMSTMWFKTNNRRYGDVLCRIAAFLLTQHNIKLTDTIAPENWECYNSDTDWLVSDWDAISGFPLIAFDDEEQSRYFTVFNPIEANKELSVEEMYEAVVSEWKNRTVSFDSGNASLITIWTQYNNHIAVSHAAALTEYEGGFLLIEKTNPQSPYQATKFSFIEQVKQYMYESIHFFDAKYGDETGTYIVLKNDVKI